MLKRHLLYIVTGANRGFGKAIVETIARHTKYRTTLVLVGRDSQSLHVNTSSSLVHSYVIGNVSLESAVGVEQTIIQPLTQLLKEWEENDAPPITKAILINNAGSTGDLSKKVGEYQAEDIQHYVQLNITSYITLINGFIQLLTEKTMASLQIVNISSLLAVEAFPHWGLYATAKAGRDMLLKVIAKEQVSDHSISVLILPPFLHSL
ncbi:hypothetical protein BDB01DRAFT_730145 [Pilobolus umbonatus]|nr:hypothetical protein BDB01DRAFT_730145 [Pilobolus umbonatus]